MLNPQIDKKNDADLIKQALRKVRFILDSNDGTFQNFYIEGNLDFELVYAIVKALEYIGEMLNPESIYHKPVSRALVNQYSNIAWKRITFIRSRFEHNYTLEIQPFDIIQSLSDIRILDKQLKGIIVTNNIPPDRFFNHDDHDVNARYVSLKNMSDKPDDYFANPIFNKIKGDEKITDKERFIYIDKNFSLLKLFIHQADIGFLNQDKNRTLREKKTSAIERATEIIGQASKDISQVTAQSLANIMKEAGKVTLMRAVFSLRTKRDEFAHAPKSPNLAAILKESEILTEIHTPIVAFLAKEYNFIECDIYKKMKVKIEMYGKKINKIKSDYETEINNLRKIITDFNLPEIEKKSKLKEYHDKLALLQQTKEAASKLMIDIDKDYSLNNQFNEQISIFYPHKGIADLSNTLRKFIQDIKDIISINEEKINHICKDSHDIIKKFTDEQTEEKRKIPEKSTIEEKDVVETTIVEERQKKLRIDEKEKQQTSSFRPS